MQLQMKNDLNIYELLNGDRRNNPERKKHDQGQSAPDPFFREAIKEAIDRNSGGLQKEKRGHRDPAKRAWKWLTQLERNSSEPD